MVSRRRTRPLPSIDLGLGDPSAHRVDRDASQLPDPAERG